MAVYEPVSVDVTEKLEEVRLAHFTELGDARIGVIFDTREKRKNFIAKIVKPNEILRYYTSDEAGEEDGYDYIIILDQIVWLSDGISDADRTRILRHELRHADFKPEKKTRKGQYALKKHDVEDFYIEIELAQQEGDGRWLERVKITADSIYDMLEDRESV